MQIRQIKIEKIRESAAKKDLSATKTTFEKLVVSKVSAAIRKLLRQFS